MLFGMGSAALAAAVAFPRFGDPNLPQGINEELNKKLKNLSEKTLECKLGMIHLSHLDQDCAASQIRMVIYSARSGV